MKHLLKIAASTLLLFGVATAPALAADHNHDRGYHGSDHGHYDNNRGNHDNGHGRYDDRGRGDYRRSDYRYRPAPPRVVYHRPAPRPYWVRGGRYYGSGYAPTYVINDYGHYGLRAPPRGYYWRRSDTGDFLLVAITTGIITDILLHH